jgi:hypothetical protein
MEISYCISKLLWNKIVKGIEILLLKSFDIIHLYVKSMIGEWCGILVTHR